MKKTKQKTKGSIKYSRPFNAYRILGVLGIGALVAAGTIEGFNHNGSYDTNEIKSSLTETVDTQYKKISFLEAKINDSLKLDYIIQVFQQNPKPKSAFPVNIVYRSDVIYFGVLPGVSGGQPIVTEIIYTNSGQIIGLEMRIARGVFLTCQTEDDFLSALIDHEYRHVELLSSSPTVSSHLSDEFTRRVRDLRGDLSQIYIELDSYYTQIIQFGKRPNLSSRFKTVTINSYNSYRNKLERMAETPLVRYLLKKFPRITPN